MTPLTPDAQTSFYIIGGTLPPDALSYVARDADAALYNALLDGKTCYVLNSRQMGKSSLCVRTIERLRANRVRAVFLDLTKFGGRNLAAEQWYAALLSEMGRELGLRTQMLAYWKDHADLPAVNRLFGALAEIALPAAPNPLIVFIDEIDVTRALPFSTDEFFAAIRQLVVGRATDPALKRLAFCLLGTATPADLIEDVTITPFNVGTRIELRDFTPKEAAPLAIGLTRSAGAGAGLLSRALHWTNGQPYMTQRLCEALRLRGAQTEREVDAAVAELFLSRSARDADDNLANVRNRLLKGSDDLAALLGLYGKVLAGKPVADEESDPKCEVLKLSGAVKSEAGLLKIRNRIYAQVFDGAWIARVMPDAELRRQKEAYLRGRNRTLALAGLVIAFVGAFAIFAVTQKVRADRLAAKATQNEQRANQKTEEAITLKRRADQNAERADKNAQAILAANKNLDDAKREAKTVTESAVQQVQDTAQQVQEAEKKVAAADLKEKTVAANLKTAEVNLAKINREKNAASQQRTAALHDVALARIEMEKADHYIYFAKVNLMQREYEDNNVSRVAQLLNETRNSKFCGFEWGYWNRMCHLNLMTLKGHTDNVSSVSFSPDGERIVSGSWDRTAKIWDAQTGKELLTLKGHTSNVLSVAFSPDSKRIVTGSVDRTARIWDAQTGRELLILKGHTQSIASVCFSPDGKRIVTGSYDKTAKIWDAQTGKELLILKGHTNLVLSVCFSPDSKRIVTGGWDRTAKIWDAQTGKELLALKGHTENVYSVCFSPDGERIVTGSVDRTAKVWDAQSGRETLTLKGHTENVYSVCFSPDGERILTGSADNTARVWDAQTGRELLALKGHTNLVSSVCFSPDGKRILTGSGDKTAKVWDAQTGSELLTLKGHTDYVSVAFSPDGKRIVTGSGDTTARVWETDWRDYGK